MFLCHKIDILATDLGRTLHTHTLLHKYIYHVD